jgi:2-dehydro-3-deoxygluconokinase
VTNEAHGHVGGARAGDGPPCDVVTLGETMVLLWPTGGESLEDAVTYERSLGGAESNLAIALARLGLRSRWISRLGDDPFGRYTRATLEREGVIVDARVDAGAPTAVFFKERVAHGPRRVYYYRRGSAASRMDPTDLTAAQFAGARLLHLTGITPALSAGCAATVDHAIALARAAGARVCVDPNVRPQLWPESGAGIATLHALMARADLVLLGDEDAAYLFPGLSDTAVLGAVCALGPRMVVLKLGARGARAVVDGEEMSVAPYPVTVVDSVGAGDGFDAGFIAGLVRGDPLPRCLALGARVGAAAVAMTGDWEGYPTSHDLGRDWHVTTAN